MADADTARLSEQIVRSDFGPLAATVASVLLTRGRLPLLQLIRFSGLKPRIVRGAILVLVQHNILWHAQSDDDGEVLEINTEECLMRLRFGRYVWQAEQLYGKAGAEVVQLILDHGKLRPPDIISQLSTYDPVKAPSVYSQALYKLVEASYLRPSTVLSHVSPRDKRMRYEAEERIKISGFPTAKELRQAKETADARLKREEEEAERIGMKRKAKDQSGRSGKRKAVEEDVVDDEVYFRVNYERFNIHIRNKLIENAAMERYNDSVGLVIRATLKATEAKQTSLTDVRSDPTSLANIAMQLSEDDDLSTGLVLQSSKKPSTMTLLKDYLAILASADNPTPAGRAASFVSVNGPKVQVEFEIIGRRLGRRILEAIARERHGDDGVRIVRLLLDTGKMDEKQISKIGMMTNKDVRPLLSALSADSLVSLQEVPKSADRNPTRTFYLWYVDLQKAYSVILGRMYKTLYNIALRRQAEEEEPGVKAVLEKRQRSDVSQDEERLLTRNEREVLAQWEKKREKLTVLEMRAEEAVFVLRDLGTLVWNDE
ncbi:RNA polymerase III subunit RPC82-domain-containing protein [Amylocystis lapponica]|nr:RNA polymerase III subunit RPC82-domain-containing protein [Amylocystis lapponica]